MNKEKLSALLAAFGAGRQAEEPWPAVKGSLAKVYKPCVRESCPVCGRGERHPAWILTVSLKGRRKCLYIPEELVPVLKRAIQNGRKIEERLGKQGLELVKAYRRQRDRAEKGRKRTAKS